MKPRLVSKQEGHYSIEFLLNLPFDYDKLQ